MTGIEKLEFQTNIENIKDHVRNVLRKPGYFLGYNNEVICAGCEAAEPDNPEDDFPHKDGCKTKKGEDSWCLLYEWVREW